MKFNTPTMQGVKSTCKHELVVIYVETNGLEDSQCTTLRLKVAAEVAATIESQPCLLLATRMTWTSLITCIASLYSCTSCTACTLNVPSNCTIHRLKSVTVSKTYSSKVKLILQSTPLRDLCSHGSDTLPFSPFGICYTSMLCMYKCMLA